MHRPRDDKLRFKQEHSDLAYTVTCKDTILKKSSSSNKYKSTAVSFHNSANKKHTQSFLNSFFHKGSRTSKAVVNNRDYVKQLQKLMSIQNLRNSEDPENQYTKPKTYKEVIYTSSKIIASCLATRKKVSKTFCQKIYHQQQSVHSLMKTHQQNQIEEEGFQKILDLPQFLQECQNRLIQEIKSAKFVKKCKKELNEFMNMVYYSGESMHSKTFSEIEQFILSQWKNNCVLIAMLDTFYLHAEQGFKGNMEYTKVEGKLSVEQFREYYHKFRELIGQTLYYTFYNYFKYLVNVRREKTRDWVIDRLVNFTSRHIICQSSSWQFIYENFISEHFETSFPQSSALNQNSLPKYYKPQLNQIFTYHPKVIFPETSLMINKFISKHKLKDKLKSLKNIRSKLEEEIIQYQSQLIADKILPDFTMFERDDFITSYLHCVVSNGVKLGELERSLKEVEMMLDDPEDFMGNTMMAMMSIYECSSYFTDLQAILEFIQIQFQKKNNA